MLEKSNDMKNAHTVSVRDHIGGHSGTAELFEDGRTIRIAVPAGDGRQRIEELINSFVAALWGDACP